MSNGDMSFRIGGGRDLHGIPRMTPFEVKEGDDSEKVLETAVKQLEERGKGVEEKKKGVWADKELKA